MYAASAATGLDSFWKYAERVGKLSNVAKAIDQNVSLPKLGNVLQGYGLTFKGKPVTEANVKALKCLFPFVEEPICSNVNWTLDLTSMNLRVLSLI